MTVLLCPLCSQPRFNTLESLRLSLVNAATQSISCPICNDVLMGLDKLTIHLFGHTLNQNFDAQAPATSLELKTLHQSAQPPLPDARSTLAPEQEQFHQHHHHHHSTNNDNNDAGVDSSAVLNTVELIDDTFKLGSEKFFAEDITEPYDTGGGEDVKTYNEDGTPDKDGALCTVNMEDLSFLTSWDNTFKSSKDNKQMDDESVKQQGSNDLSEYMSKLLNKKMPIVNFAFTLDNVEKSQRAGNKPARDDESRQLRCGTCGFAFQNAIILSMHEELVHQGKTKISAIEEGASSVMDSFPCAEMNLDSGECKQTDKRVEDDVAAPTGTVTPLTTSLTPSKGISSDAVDREGLEATLLRYDCHLCSKSFKMRGSLLLHFRVAHFGLVSPESLQILGDSSSPSEARSHPCPTCNKSFKKEQHLTQHLKTHEGKQWQCGTCNKHFTTKYFLKKHQRLHTGEMPYSCLTCKKTFTFQQSYHKHLLYHSDEKPHQCGQCGRSFKELSTLHNHERIHSGEKPFACETCGKCFRQRVSYIVHQRIHTGVLPYQCTACKKKFRYKVSQRSHKCTAQPPGIVIRQPDIVQKILENKNILQNPV